MYTSPCYNLQLSLVKKECCWWDVLAPYEDAFMSKKWQSICMLKFVYRLRRGFLYSHMWSHITFIYLSSHYSKYCVKQSYNTTTTWLSCNIITRLVIFRIHVSVLVGNRQCCICHYSALRVSTSSLLLHLSCCSPVQILSGK